jgi:hypothetical protein
MGIAKAKVKKLGIDKRLAKGQVKITGARKTKWLTFYSQSGS